MEQETETVQKADRHSHAKTATAKTATKMRVAMAH